MLFFEVTVHPQRVTVNEVQDLEIYDYRARVDGEHLCYKIIKSKKNPPKDKGWHGRATNTVHYHAKNSGTLVEFVPVNRLQSVYRRRNSQKIDLF